MGACGNIIQAMTKSSTDRSYNIDYRRRINVLGLTT
jgi:hypothetical protein